MKVHIRVVDDKGSMFEGTAELEAVSRGLRRQGGKATVQSARGLSFSLNRRAFMNKYAKGLSGSQKFALLIAHIANGKSGHAISSDQISSEWNRIKGIVGGFNTAHATRAKERGWINAPKRGFYALSDTWKEVIGTN